MQDTEVCDARNDHIHSAAGLKTKLKLSGQN